MENINFFNLCKEGEEVVKTYECTKVKKLFFGKAIGFLTLTNKRVLYHAFTSGILGKNIVLNEMPIEDFTGFSAQIGSSINWVFIAVISLFLFVLNDIGHITQVIPIIFRHLLFGILAIAPYIALLLKNKNILNIELKIPENVKPFIYYLFIYGIFILGLNILPNVFVLRIIFYGVIVFVLFRKSSVFSIAIYSKSSNGAGIYLPGVQTFRLFGREFNTAADTMTGAPAKDSETVINEIGALITDLKQMGDLAIEKWQ